MCGGFEVFNFLYYFYKFRKKKTVNRLFELSFLDKNKVCVCVCVCVEGGGEGQAV